MIHRIFCDNENFNEVRFKSGLNIILCVENEDRFRKARLVEIIDFCLGSNVDKNSYLKKIKEIENWTFSIDMDLFESRYIISRSINNSNKIYIDGDLNKLPESLNKEDGKYFLKLKDWKSLLASYLFDLDDNTEKYSPSFRSLISYFIRKLPESYNEAFKHHTKQQNWDIQVNTAFLLGLNWKHPSAFQKNKDSMRNVKKQLKTFDKSTIGEMESKKINLENELNKKIKDYLLLKSMKIMMKLKIRLINYPKNYLFYQTQICI